MKSVTRLRPTPATLIALLALFVSLGGVSYGVATGYIDSREIKNNSTVRSKDLRNNEIRGLDIRNSTVQGRDVAISSIGGEDIRESTLAEVPSAERAGTAGAVDSLRAIGARTIAQGAPVNVLLTYGPLPLTASCTAGGSGPRGAGPRPVDPGRLERRRRGGLGGEPGRRPAGDRRGHLGRGEGGRVLTDRRLGGRHGGRQRGRGARGGPGGRGLLPLLRARRRERVRDP